MLALEGGYDIKAICDSTEACLQTLLGENPPAISEAEYTRPPNKNAINTLHEVLKIQVSLTKMFFFQFLLVFWD